MKLYKLYVVLSLWATGSLGLASCSDFLKEEPYAFGRSPTSWAMIMRL